MVDTENGDHSHMGLSEMNGKLLGETLEMENEKVLEGRFGNARAEVDTSAPFESVKEAVSRFGGVGYWKPTQNNLSQSLPIEEEVDASKLEERAGLLEKELIVKERETLDVLKDLESTKKMVDDLKSKLHKAATDADASVVSNKNEKNRILGLEDADKENQGSQFQCMGNSVDGLSAYPSSAPANILMELNQAKLNLTRTTTDLADIRASVDLFNKKLEKERVSLEKTRERLAFNSSKISSLEKELNQTRLKLQLTKNGEIKGGFDNPEDMTRELQRLSCEAEQFKKMGEAAKSEVLRMMSEMDHTKTMIRTAEIRFIAAEKMRDAARAAQAVALAEIKGLSNHLSSVGNSVKNQDAMTFSFEEYNSLIGRAKDADELSKKRVADAMMQVDEANISKMEILKRVEAAAAEVNSSKKALEEALSRVESANKGKLAVEEALRKWRSDHSQKRRSVQSSTKFKNPGTSNHRRESGVLDVNGLTLVNDVPRPVLKPTLSIGQILSRKLLLPEEFEMASGRGSVKRKVSLGQILDKNHGDPNLANKAERGTNRKHITSKSNKFGFARVSRLLVKRAKTKKLTPNLK